MPPSVALPLHEKEKLTGLHAGRHLFPMLVYRWIFDYEEAPLPILARFTKLTSYARSTRESMVCQHLARQQVALGRAHLPARKLQ